MTEPKGLRGSGYRDPEDRVGRPNEGKQYSISNFFTEEGSHDRRGSGFGFEAAMRPAQKGFDVIAAVEIYAQVQTLKWQATASKHAVEAIAETCRNAYTREPETLVSS
ncbi:hypothetical protein ACFYXM_23090 [Streptomyces sp. NPDC002476]|uniref:hypothetical protein n=1 Tax=Streptomyces sp. NPDC002476 TaxID=3364648 RepID=UPI0036D17EDB